MTLVAFLNLEASSFPNLDGKNNYHYSQIEHYKHTRISQISITIYKLNNDKYTMSKINNHFYNIDEINGISFIEAINLIYKDLCKCSLIISTEITGNMLANYNILLSELYRYNMIYVIKTILNMNTINTPFLLKNTAEVINVSKCFYDLASSLNVK